MESSFPDESDERNAAPETGSEPEEDFVHESVDLPGWIAVAFGLILVAIAALAIWTG